jgi:CheY-like chemotaxis protein
LEDDRDMIMLLRTLLEIEGYTVAQYDAGVPAVELVLREKPDVILLDVHLGGQNGVQILRDVRQNPQVAPVRVVMTSGLNVTEECIRNGADAFIVKPYMPDTLLDLLKSVMATPAGERFVQAPPAKPGASATMAKFL